MGAVFYISRSNASLAHDLCQANSEFSSINVNQTMFPEDRFHTFFHFLFLSLLVLSSYFFANLFAGLGMNPLAYHSLQALRWPLFSTVLFYFTGYLWRPLTSAAAAASVALIIALVLHWMLSFFFQMNIEAIYLESSALTLIIAGLVVSFVFQPIRNGINLKTLWIVALLLCLAILSFSLA